MHWLTTTGGRANECTENTGSILLCKKDFSIGCLFVIETNQFALETVTKSTNSQLLITPSIPTVVYCLNRMGIAGSLVATRCCCLFWSIGDDGCRRCSSSRGRPGPASGAVAVLIVNVTRDFYHHQWWWLVLSASLLGFYQVMIHDLHWMFKLFYCHFWHA